MTSNPPSDLWSITYTSSAVTLPSQAQLDQLLRQARARNHKLAITGVLLYYDGAFLQCIEGPRPALQRVYAAICADPRHQNVSELVREPIARREYAEWSMAMCFIAGGIDTSGDERLLARLGAPQEGASASRRLVSAFWTGGMELKCSRAFA